MTMSSALFYLIRILYLGFFVTIVMPTRLRLVHGLGIGAVYIVLMRVLPIRPRFTVV